MKEAAWYEKGKGELCKCNLCPKYCIIKSGWTGFCNVRKNIDGTLFSLVYGKPCSVAVDPIEKKPLFHFLPSTKSFSVGTTGCNLDCSQCQNSDISRANFDEVPNKNISPEQIISAAVLEGCNSIAYTYTEPTVFYEYVLETAKLAKKEGIKNIMVTNGYINKKPLVELYKYIDAANIDLKSFNNSFYKKTCKGDINPVLSSIKLIKKLGVWVELTYLIIPSLNDDLEEIEQMCKWILENIGADVPLHFSKFFPCYKLTEIPQTPLKTLHDAKTVAEKYLNYVYIGNIPENSNTFCKSCGKIVIGRVGYSTVDYTEDGMCSCKKMIPGVWK